MPVELDPRLVARLLRFVAGRYERRDPAHDLRHVERILARVGPLGAGVDPAPRPHVLAFLCCFHGMAAALRDDPPWARETHELLAALGWTEAERVEALELVPRHLEDPRTSEERIVHDANYVELLGALGIAKAFTTGGARGQAYAETIAIFERRYLDRVVFRTPVGRRMAELERPYVKAFLRRLERELQGDCWPDPGEPT